jgi:hypothetical protein
LQAAASIKMRAETQTGINCVVVFFPRLYLRFSILSLTTL